MKKVTILFSLLIIFCLAGATIFERLHGTGEAHRLIYGSAWFMILWAALAVSSLIYIVRQRLRRLPALLLHCSFLLILLGALVTALTARHGLLHLRTGEVKSSFTAVDGEKERVIEMPFQLTLDTFLVAYYAGTAAPADYISRVTVRETASGASFSEQISMNRIFSHHGIRFYQSAFDDDGQGSSFTVNQDLWGIPITYGGYFALFITLIWNLFAPKGRMRQLLRDPMLKRSALALLLLLGGGAAMAQPATLPREEARQLGELQVLYNNRITPLHTLATDLVHKLIGEASYKGYTAEQFLSGWLFFAEAWKREPLIRVKSGAVRQELGLKPLAALSDFIAADGRYLLQPYWRQLHQRQPTPFLKAVAELDEKIQLLAMLRNGALLQLFPCATAGGITWYAPTAELPEGMGEGQRLFTMRAFELIGEAVRSGDHGQVGYLLSKLKGYQQKNGGESLLSERKVKAEILYNSVPFAGWLFKVNLLVGLMALIFVRRRCGESPRTGFRAGGRRRRFGAGLRRGASVVAAISFLTVSFLLALRTYISGRAPMSNGYETMLLLSWCLLLITLLFHRRIRILLPFGLLLSGFCLLVASLNEMNPQITPLMPALSSPLLSIHVSLIMMSYALFAFTFLNGLLALAVAVRRRSQKKGFDSAQPPAAWRLSGVEGRRLAILSQLLLHPAITLLAIGIFIGAIWANVSWGRYWSWDPKEVWALITLLIYAAALHVKSLDCLKRPLLFHLYLCVAFLSLLITYFGVNYLLGGMHSYA
jgi:cytochrome c-type biogenesis protein CcsB